MAAGKKEMANKTISLRPSSSKDTFASMLAREFNDNERAAGNGESLLLFSRKNAMLGSLPWTSSLRKVGLRRGAPRHSLQSQQRGFVRQFDSLAKVPMRISEPTEQPQKSRKTTQNTEPTSCTCASAHMCTSQPVSPDIWPKPATNSKHSSRRIRVNKQHHLNNSRYKN